MHYSWNIVTFERKRSGRHSIGLVSRRTGLKPDVIRAWERRYGAVKPKRTETNRRYYSDEQLERLTLLREVTLAGRQIGQVAELETEELRAMVAEDQAAMAQFPKAAPFSADVSASSQFVSCLSAVQRMDSQELQLQLERSSLELSPPILIEEVLVPLIREIGELWQEGTLRIAHEHIATAIIRNFLANLRSAVVPTGTAPSIVVATPYRQYHELGALLVAATASSEGWEVLYLGADSPTEEIAALALLRGARAVALSIVYPSDDPLIGSELKKLRRLLGDEILLLVGGRAAKAYKDQILEASGHLVSEMSEVREQLRLLRE
jgi:DNA-binding transcriptional MerR regulator/methylmalonyl-CoA mutase cobalamin-binding subunit